MKADTKSIWRAGLVGGTLTAAANLGIYATGRVTGVEFGLQPGGFAAEVGPDQVIIASLVTFAIGTVLAVVVGRRGARELRILQILGAAVAVATAGAPLSMAVGTSSKILLLAMHLVAGAAYVLSLERLLRRCRTAGRSDRVGYTATS